MNRKRGKRSGRVLFGGRENRGGIQTRNLLHVKKTAGGVRWASDLSVEADLKADRLTKVSHLCC